MIGNIETGTLKRAEISAVIHQGLTVRTASGKPARLAIIDADGNILESGEDVAREAFNTAIACYKNFLRGQGHLRTASPTPKAKAA